MNITPGTLLKDRYRIKAVLGQGGMGSVYRAVDENLDVPVAVKENLFLTEEYSRQFQKEANILASLHHHSLPRVRDYFTLPGVGQYLVMDFIEGEDLRQRIERMGTLPEDEVVLIGAHICNALEHLHTRPTPIIHRDLKPGNIKITPEGDVALVDFGLAKEMHTVNQATTTGARAMTPGYSPPEQYGTAHTDARSDIYSLGATLYAALTGVIPEDGLTRVTGKTELTPIRELRPRINRKLASVIETALSVDPEDRYQTASEMREALIEAGNLVHKFQQVNTVAPPPQQVPAADGEESGCLPAVPFRPMRMATRSRRRRRNTWTNVMLAASVTLIVVLMMFLLLQRQPPAAVGQTGDGTQIPSVEASLPAPSTDIASTAQNTEVPVVAGDPTEPAAPPTAENSITPLPSPTPLGGGRSEIAYVSNRLGNYQVWLMNSDGSGQRQLTEEEGGACQPAWSPDGMKLAYITPCSGRRDTYPGASIFIYDMETGDSTPLPVKPGVHGDFDPAWSPDNEKIAFTTLRNGRSQIFIYDFNTSLLTELSKTIFADKHPAWNPSGLQLAFVRQTPNGQVWIMGRDGTLQAQFSPAGGVNNLWPAWSRDGDMILYSQTTVDVFNPWLIALRFEDRNSAREFRIPASTARDIGPVAEIDPSPDGEWLAFESWPGGVNHDIFVMTIRGTDLARLTTDRAFDISPAWRP